MKAALIFSVLAMLVGLGIAANNDSHNINMTVPAVDALEIPEGVSTAPIVTLTLVAPAAGETFTSVINGVGEVSLNYSTNGTARKITAELDSAMPAGLMLEIVPAAAVFKASCETDNTIYGTEYTGEQQGHLIRQQK